MLVIVFTDLIKSYNSLIKTIYE